MTRAFEIHFFQTKTGYELVETCLITSNGHPLRCIRGKTAGAFRGSGSFQWTSAVKAIAALSLRHILAKPIPSLNKYISGRQSSLAASLDYALTKAPCWISDMFGVCQNGQLMARRLFLITNPNQKRPGPVTIAINDAPLSPSEVQVFLDGHLTKDFSTLVNILRDIEAGFPRESFEPHYEPVGPASEGCGKLAPEE